MPNRTLFRQGELVRLRSGGPAMVVEYDAEAVEAPGAPGADDVQVVWFDRFARHRSARFPVRLLQSADASIPVVKPPRRFDRRTLSQTLLQPRRPSPELAAIVGPDPLPRCEAVTRVWTYIRRNGLQDPADRRRIVADAALRPVLGGKDRVSMFAMSRDLARHLLPDAPPPGGGGGSRAAADGGGAAAEGEAAAAHPLTDGASNSRKDQSP